MLSTTPAYSPRTIAFYIKNLIFLDKHVDLNDSQTVILFIINNKNNNDLRKRSLFNAYSVYCKVFSIQKPERRLRGGLHQGYRKIPEIPTEEVINKIIDNANLFYSVLFDFLKNTGCRTIELINLRIENVKGNIVTINTAKAGGMATRQVKISDKLLEKLKRHIVKGRTIGFLFERNGKQLREERLRKQMIRYREKVARRFDLIDAKKVHLHTFRHFYASKLYQETKDLVLVKTLLGHSNIKSTEIYTHIIKFDENRFEAKAISVQNTEDVCKMLTEGWNVVTTTQENVFMRRNIF